MQIDTENMDSFPSQCIITLASLRGRTMRGRVHSNYYKKSFRFNNECEMLNGMENLFDSLMFPQATFEARSFFSKKTTQIFRRAESEMDDNTNNIPQEGKTTFIVNVQYRQNATWQGTITWVEQNTTQHFRSAFEMLKLMDQANRQGIEEVIQWDDSKDDQEEL